MVHVSFFEVSVRDLERVIAPGGEVLYPTTDAGSYGFVAEFAVSEGKCIALCERA